MPVYDCLSRTGCSSLPELVPVLIYIDISKVSLGGKLQKLYIAISPDVGIRRCCRTLVGTGRASGEQEAGRVPLRPVVFARSTFNPPQSRRAFCVKEATMIKVHILTTCNHCVGVAYLPVGEAESYTGEKYTRYQPCP